MVLKKYFSDIITTSPIIYDLALDFINARSYIIGLNNNIFLGKNESVLNNFNLDINLSASHLNNQN